MHLCQVINCPPGLGFSHQASYRALPDWIVALLAFRATPRNEESTFTDSRFDALATCHVEGLRARKGCVISMKSAFGFSG